MENILDKYYIHEYIYIYIYTHLITYKVKRIQIYICIYLVTNKVQQKFYIISTYLLLLSMKDFPSQQNSPFFDDLVNNKSAQSSALEPPKINPHRAQLLNRQNRFLWYELILHRFGLWKSENINYNNLQNELKY